jgi:hypothetical protein
MMKHNYLIALLIVASTVTQSSCQRRHDAGIPSLQQEKSDYVLAIVLDASGSFGRKMLANDAVAHRFFLRATEKFFRDRGATDDKIVVAQLSAERKSLLWEGKPTALRRRFPDTQAFNRFLLDNSKQEGSRVHSAIADTLDYVMDLPGVSEKQTRVLVLVLSDMKSENAEEPAASKARLLNSLQRFGRLEGAIGLYWVDQGLVSEWKEHLKDAGVRNSAVYSEIIDDPPLPLFE